MKTMKLSRVLSVMALALVLAVVFAVGVLADYTVYSNNTIKGLSGTATATRYNFTTGAWDETTTVSIDSETVLAGGLWQITEGSNSGTVYVYGENAGKLAFDFANTGKQFAHNTFGQYKAGDWTLLGDKDNKPMLQSVQYYDTASSTYSSLIFNMTASIGWSVDAATGALTVLEGAEEKFQSSGVRYTFADDQIIPATASPVLTFSAPINGSAGNWKMASDATKANITGTLIFRLKSATGGEDKSYTVNVNGTMTSFAAPAAMANDAGYYVYAIDYAPYATTALGTIYPKVSSKATDGVTTYYFSTPQDHFRTPAKSQSHALSYTAPVLQDPPAPAAPTGIVGSIGAIAVPGDAANYEIAPITLNITGDGALIGEYVAFNANASYIGLYAVRDVSKLVPSEPAYVFAYGSEEARQDILPQATKSGHTGIATKSNGTSGALTYEPGYWTGHGVTTYAGLNPDTKITVGSGEHLGGATADSVLAVWYANQNDTTEQAVLDAAAAVEYIYTYTDKNIVKASEFVSFSAMIENRQSPVTVTGLYPQYTLKVLETDGTVTDYTYTFPTAIKINNGVTEGTFVAYSEDFSASGAPALADSTGYVVAVVVHPYTGGVALAGTNSAVTTTRTAMYNCCGYLAGMTTVVKENATTGNAPAGNLAVANKVITGFKAGSDYEWTTVDVGANGFAAYGEWATVSGTSLDLSANSGLVAIRERFPIASSYYYSDTQVFLLNTEKTVNIWHTHDEPSANDPNGSKASESQCAASCHSASGILDYISIEELSTGGFDVPTYTQGWWHAPAGRDRMLVHFGLVKVVDGVATEYALGSNKTYLSSAQKAYTDATTDTEKAAASALLKDAVNSIKFTYAFLDEEIIKMEDFKSFTYRVGKRQGSVLFNRLSDGASVSKINTLFTLVVLTDDGHIVERSVKLPMSVTSQNAPTAATASIEDFIDAGIATDGYIVAMNITPYYVDDTMTVTANGSTGFDVDIFMGASATAKATAWQIKLPKATAPAGLTINGTTVSGFDATKEYVWAPLTVNGHGAETVIKNTTSTTLSGTGLIAIYVKGDNITTDDSDAVVYWLPGTLAARSELGEKVASGTDKDYYVTNTGEGFIQGTWTGSGARAGAVYGTSYSNNMIATTGSGYVLAVDITALRDAVASGNAATITAAEELIKDKAAAGGFQYAYTNDEIVKASDLMFFRFTTWQRQGTLTLKGATVKVTFYVVNEIGEIVEYVWTAPSSEDDHKVTHLIDTNALFEGVEGWIVGVRISPWTNVTEIIDNGTVVLNQMPAIEYDMTTDYAVIDSTVACTSHNFAAKFPIEKYFASAATVQAPAQYYYACTVCGEKGTETYDVGEAIAKYATPTLEISAGTLGDIRINNYNANYIYMYSTDDGATWAQLPTLNKNKFTPELSTTYQIKVAASGTSLESDVAEITSPAVRAKGYSLVLDGQIGIRWFVEVDTDIVDSLSFGTSKVNNDYEADYTDPVSGKLDPTLPGYWGIYKVQGFATFESGDTFLTKIEPVEGQPGIYSAVFYAPAKDIDNIHFETGLTYKYKDSYDGKKSTVQNDDSYYAYAGGAASFNEYILEAKQKAANGEAEFVKALDLINQLEDYGKYADGYFKGTAMTAYTSTALAGASFTAPTKSNAALTGLEFYGTSLVLEDNVTIRHYFTVNDLAAFNAAYDCDIAYGEKNNMIYFDIADISANELGDVQTLTFYNKGTTTAAYTVSYSVTNYIDQQRNSSDANLVSLVNKMYDYYLAAVDYHN